MFGAFLVCFVISLVSFNFFLWVFRLKKNLCMFLFLFRACSVFFFVLSVIRFVCVFRCFFLFACGCIVLLCLGACACVSFL